MTINDIVIFDTNILRISLFYQPCKSLFVLTFYRHLKLVISSK